MKDATIFHISEFHVPRSGSQQDQSSTFAESIPSSNAYTMSASTNIVHSLIEAPLAGEITTLGPHSDLVAGNILSNPTTILTNLIPTNSHGAGPRASRQESIPSPPKNDVEVEHWRAMYEHLSRIFYRQSTKAFDEISKVSDLVRSSDQEETSESERSVIRLIELLGEPALVAIKAILHEDVKDRLAYSFLLECLAHTDDHATQEVRIQLMQECTKSLFPQIRFAALSALGETGTPLALKTIRDALAHEGNREVRRVALDYLK